VISLRTHAISLAAVFLALAIGVALGSGLLSNTVLSGLRDDKQELQNQINGLTDERNALNEKLSAAGEFDAQMSPRILRDTMGAKSVVVFRTPDASDDDVESLKRMVEQAGGTVTRLTFAVWFFLGAVELLWQRRRTTVGAFCGLNLLLLGTQAVVASQLQLDMAGSMMSGWIFWSKPSASIRRTLVAEISG